MPSVPGTTVAITWQGRRTEAWTPDPLVARDLAVSIDCARRAERAVAAVRVAHGHLPAEWEPLARLLLKAEGIASSYIEGVRAPVADVSKAEIDADVVDRTAAWVADNLAAATTAIGAAAGARLSVNDLHRWHERLMRHGGLPTEMVGRFRPVQGWIGGSSPLDAVFVPPPPGLVGDLMDDLVAFANRDDLDSVTQSAVAHAQFETIHPYGDGNGRIGRLLVGWILARVELVAVPPPVSVFIARDPGGYLSGLHAYRTGDLETWVSWFATVVREGAEAMVAVVDRVEALTADWLERIADVRSDATARSLLALLPAHPVLSARLVADRLGVSERAARTALSVLQEHGVVEPFKVVASRAGRPPRWWSVPSVLDVLRSWAP
jgi:Fic family protein